MKVMQQRFGAGVRQEVLGEVISQSFQEAVVSENLRPAGQPLLKHANDAGQDVEYTATFEVFPSVAISPIDVWPLAAEPMSPRQTSTTLSKCSESSRASS